MTIIESDATQIWEEYKCKTGEIYECRLWLDTTVCADQQNGEEEFEFLFIYCNYCKKVKSRGTMW